MLPWGHAAFGYLSYTLYSRWRIGYRPIGLAVLALGLGTQFPDLIDKPLTWTVQLLPYGRSLTHSLLTFTVIVSTLRILTKYPDQRTLVNAFAIGYFSHLVADSVYPVLTQNYAGLGYWLWPLTAVPEGGSRSFTEFFLSLEVTPIVVSEGVLTVVGMTIWVYDGMPGVKDLYAEYIQ